MHICKRLPLLSRFAQREALANLAGLGTNIHVEVGRVLDKDRVFGNAFI